MVSLRKGKCYRKFDRPYTRHSKVRSKDYVKAIPGSKVVRYEMGNIKKEFKYKVDLISKQDLQIRHNALESSRLVVNKNLHSKLGPTNYLFKINVYPHHVLRENKMLTGAGADRMSQGMQQAFGRAIGTAAQVKKGKIVLSVGVDDAGLEIAKSCLKLATPRLPGKYSIEVKKAS